MDNSKTLPVIVLAGGFGTRLQHVVSDVPKPMAPINSKPFLELLFDYLIDEGIQEVILATGFKADVIRTHFGDKYQSLSVFYSHEEERLGTGGAILQAFQNFNLEEAFVINGDTFFPISLMRLQHFHSQFSADLTVAIKYIQNFDRYGTLTWNAYNRITAFHEKIPQEEGWINGGIYCINKKAFGARSVENFSFETDIMERYVDEGKFYALPFLSYFMDIGIPTDYQAFQTWEKEGAPIESKNKTLFIDRDGVINKRIPGDYVRSPKTFEMLPGVVEAFKILRQKFKRIIVVTNQQGIGKGLMSHEDLSSVHEFFATQLNESGVVLDAIDYAPGLANDHPEDRKPNVGMAFRNKSKFSDIDWSACYLIGDSTSDIEFGLRMGMETILVGEKSQTTLSHHKFADLKTAVDQMDF